MLLTDIVSILALLGFRICWFRVGMARRDALLWASVSVALLASIAGYANYRGTAMIALVVALVLLLGLVIRRLRGSRVLSGTPWLSGVLFSLLTAFAAFGYWTFPIFEMPAPSGEHAVGVRDFELTDTSRKGVLAAGPEEPRRILVRVWYPAGSVAGLEPRPYFTDAEAATTASRYSELYLKVPWVFTHFRHVDTHSYENAPLLPGAGQQPVVFFSHGYMGSLSQNTGVMEELASHGYIVYSVSHAYDGVDGLFPNGDPIPADDKLWAEMWEAMFPGGEAADNVNGPTMAGRRAGMIAMLERYIRDDARFHRSVGIWIEDRLFVKDELVAGRVDPAMAEIAAAGDFTRVGHTGMSFGGSTAVSVCWRDADCAAVVNLDGGNFDPQMFNRSVDKPLLMFMHDWPVMRHLLEGYQGWDYSEYGYADLSYEAHSVAGARDDIYRLRVEDVQHLGVSDLILVVRGPVKSALSGGIDGPAMMAVMNDFVRGFFDKHIRGLDNDFPAARFSRYSQDVAPHDTGRVRDWWNSLSETERAELPAGPDVAASLIAAGKAGVGAMNPIATITMEDGRQISLELYPDRAPESVRSFIHLAETGHYNDQPLGRVEKDLLIQGGSDELDWSATPGCAIRGEFLENGVNDRTHFSSGTIGFGRVTPDGGGSIWFITTGNQASLDGKYAAFGHVVEGLQHVVALSRIPARPLSEDVAFMHTPLQPPTVKSITVETFGVDYPEPEKLPEITPEEAMAELMRAASSVDN